MKPRGTPTTRNSAHASRRARALGGSLPFGPRGSVQLGRGRLRELAIRTPSTQMGIDKGDGDNIRNDKHTAGGWDETCGWSGIPDVSRADPVASPGGIVHRPLRIRATRGKPQETRPVLQSRAHRESVEQGSDRDSERGPQEAPARSRHGPRAPRFRGLPRLAQESRRRGDPERSVRPAPPSLARRLARPVGELSRRCLGPGVRRGSIGVFPSWSRGSSGV